MFDIKLKKSKFYTKSKSAIAMTKTRIARIKRKRKAMVKFLNKDIADLLNNGLDVNAYGRVEGLWNELNLSSCYEFIEQFCNQISTHLTNMDKQRECPDVCREAVSSLMVAAAARFADLPELNDLGNVLLQRFGTCLDHYVNKEFNNKIKSMTPPTKDMKVQVMQEIAKLSGVEWNAKNLEQKLFNPPPAAAAAAAVIVNECTKDDVRNRHSPEMMAKNEADYEDTESRKKGWLYNDEKRTELSRDQSVDHKNVEEGNRPPSDDQVVVDMEEPFYYKTIRLPSYKFSLKQDSDTNLDLQRCHSTITYDTTTRPKPKSVRTRSQKASPAAAI